MSRAIPSGENLWMGPRQLYGYAVMVGSFLDEKRLYRMGAPMKTGSITGNWHDIGHYMQLIWRATQEIGCAVAENADNEYLVCRYFPAGNSFDHGPLDADTGAPVTAEVESGKSAVVASSAP